MAVAKQLFFVALSIFSAFVIHKAATTVREWQNPQHVVVNNNISPAREHPDSETFYAYFQNKQGLWLFWREWFPYHLDLFVENKEDVLGTPSHPATAAQRRIKKQVSLAKVKGVVFVVGGMGDHTSRYDILARRWLVPDGYVVFNFDNQGMGESEGERKYVERFTHFVDDAQLFIESRLAMYPELKDKPKFLFGHSLGGLISTLTAYRIGHMFNGVVVTAPAFKVSEKLAGETIKKIGLYISEHLPKCPVVPGGIDPLFANNPQLRGLNDPLSLRYMPVKARLGAETLTAIERVFKEIQNATYPMLILHGDDDRLTDMSGSARFYEAAVSKDKKFVPLKDIRHDLIHDAKSEEIIGGEVLSFFDARLAKR